MVSSSQSENPLPREYREVQWLRGSGTQYAELSYIPHLYASTDSFNCLRGDITILSISSSKLAIIANDMYHGTISTKSRFGIMTSNPNLLFCYGVYSGGSQVLQETFNMNDYGTSPLEIHYELNCLRNGSAILNNDTKTFLTQNSANFDKILVGAYYSTSGVLTIHNEDTLIKKFSYYEGETLLSEYIPCYRKSDNKAGFYETGTGLFLTNRGTGSDWLIGPNK